LPDELAILNWIKRHLGATPPAVVAAATPSHRSAMRQGRLVAGMTAREVEASLCVPDQIWRDRTVEPEVEKWIYLNQSGDHLAAILLGGRATGQTLRMTPEAYEALPSSKDKAPVTPSPDP